MAVPKRKQSKANTRMRRAHHAITLPNPVSCPQCGEPKMSHRVCPSCGYYKDRQVVAKED